MLQVIQTCNALEHRQGMGDQIGFHYSIIFRVIVGNFPAVKLPHWWVEAVIWQFTAIFWCYRLRQSRYIQKTKICRPPKYHRRMALPPKHYHDSLVLPPPPKSLPPKTKNRLPPYGITPPAFALPTITLIILKTDQERGATMTSLNEKWSDFPQTFSAFTFTIANVIYVLPTFYVYLRVVCTIAAPCCFKRSYALCRSCPMGLSVKNKFLVLKVAPVAQR